MKKISLCRLFGHNWKFNFSVLANKCIYSRCKLKMKLNLETLGWEVVNQFSNESRSDKKLINKWIK